MDTQPNLFNLLQSEFCPPLDSSLLAALLAELELDSEGEPPSLSSNVIQTLRSTLEELAAQADEAQLNDDLANFQWTSPTDESSSNADLYQSDTTTPSSLSSNSSYTSQQSFSSPLGFLQAAFPHIPSKRLSQAISRTGDGDNIDMEEIIAEILTDEYIRELEERGLDALDDDEISNVAMVNTNLPWETAGSKKSHEPKSNNRKIPRGKKVTLVDIRQRQHARPTISRNNNDNSQRQHPVTDPWTQLSSISAHVATLLPPHSSSFFQSYFHSPEHTTPYHALHAALTSISNQSSSTQDEHIDILFTLLDILLPSYESLNSEERLHLVSDTQLSLAATAGRADDTLDLVKILRDLASDSGLGHFEMGVYHSPLPSQAKTTNLATGPPPIPPPPQSKFKQKAPPPPFTTHKPSPYQWQSVHRRRTPNSVAHPLAEYIPAYRSGNNLNGRQVRGSGNGIGKGGKGDLGELKEHQRRMAESMRKRNEMLQEASKMWQRGNSKTRGGEVAYYFAERAREFQELARKEALDAARTMVESKRLTSHNHDTVDLHGTTVAEAIVVVKETLQRNGSSPQNPLKIITGRGTHSANKIGVLKPAIKAALIDDGWNVGNLDAGLIVRGKKGRG